MGLEQFKQAVADIHGKYILDYLENTGVNRDEYEIEEEEPVNKVELAKKKKGIDPNTSFYYYDGPFDDKTRPFCQALLRMNKFWDQLDLDLLSNKLGYSVFLYEGGFNCRHVWKRARIKQKLIEGIVPDQPDFEDRDRAASKQQKGLGKYF